MQNMYCCPHHPPLGRPNALYCRAHDLFDCHLCPGPCPATKEFNGHIFGCDRPKDHGGDHITKVKGKTHSWQNCNVAKREAFNSAKKEPRWTGWKLLQNDFGDDVMDEGFDGGHFL